MTLLAAAKINCSLVFELKHCGRHLTVNKQSLLHSWRKGVVAERLFQGSHCPCAEKTVEFKRWRSVSLIMFELTVGRRK